MYTRPNFTCSGHGSRECYSLEQGDLSACHHHLCHRRDAGGACSTSRGLSTSDILPPAPAPVVRVEGEPQLAQRSHLPGSFRRASPALWWVCCSVSLTPASRRWSWRGPPRGGGRLPCQDARRVHASQPGAHPSHPVTLQRHLIDRVRAGPSLKEICEESHLDEVQEAFSACLEELVRFRTDHLVLVARYRRRPHENHHRRRQVYPGTASGQQGQGDGGAPGAAGHWRDSPCHLPQEDQGRYQAERRR